MSQWFFQHNACLRRVQTAGGELLAHGGEQAGRGGQVHHHAVGFALGQACFQLGVGFGVGQVHAHVAQQAGKAGKLFAVGAFGTVDLFETHLNLLTVLFVAQVVAAHEGCRVGKLETGRA